MAEGYAIGEVGVLGGQEIPGRLTFAEVKMGTEAIPRLRDSIRKANNEWRDYGKGILRRAIK